MRWPNFKKSELACPHCGKLIIDEKAIDALQKLRTLMGAPLIINSAYRCKAHNASLENAAKGSKHVLGIAFDIAVGDHDRQKLYWSAQIAGFNGFGFMIRALHVDTRKERAYWNYGPASVTAWKGIIPAGTKQTGT